MYSRLLIFPAMLAALFFVSNLLSIANYQAFPLERIRDSRIVKDDLVLSYKKFDRADCRRYLGRSNILAKGYQPVQIQITNNTKRRLLFTPDNLSFPVVPYIHVAEHVRFNTTLRLLLWGVGTIFFWPLIIPFVLDAIESPKANEYLHDDYIKKSLGIAIVEPGSTLNGLVFVARNQFHANFKCILIDQETNDSINLYAR